MTKDEAIQELLKLRQLWELEQQDAEADGNSDYAIIGGAIDALDVSLEIVKEIN
jgi:hypothetical protein